MSKLQWLKDILEDYHANYDTSDTEKVAGEIDAHYHHPKRMICPVSANCGEAKECYHANPHELKDYCSSGCFGNSGCVPVDNK